jgi:pimeloyl-ACP methyl ester carboxylesterase
MNEQGHLGRWRRSSGERRCRALEDSLWSDRPEAAPVAIDIDTRFGPTRAYHWVGDGLPIVLLHGGACTSIVWRPLAESLHARGANVYAVDIMGDVGRSEHRVPFADMTDMAPWLDDALDALGLERVHLVGHSLGGMVALHVALGRPARLDALTLFDPGGVVPLHLRPFLWWGLPVMLSSFLPSTVRQRVARWKRHPLATDARQTRLMLLGLVHHHPGFPAKAPDLTDDELSSITMPTTLVVGEKTEMFDSAAMVERTRRLLPAVRAITIPGAGHALTVSHVDACVAGIEGARR